MLGQFTGATPIDILAAFELVAKGFTAALTVRLTGPWTGG